MRLGPVELDAQLRAARRLTSTVSSAGDPSSYSAHRGGIRRTADARRVPVIGICAALERARWTRLGRGGVPALARLRRTRPGAPAASPCMLPPDPCAAEDPDDAARPRSTALVLAGGADIDPAATAPSATATTGDHGRSATRPRSRWPAARSSATCRCLGICRGMQVLNVARGGTLHPAPARRPRPHRPPPHLGSFDDADHDVRLAPGSLAARAAGESVTPPSPTTTRASTRSARGSWRRGWSVLDDLVEAIEVPAARCALGVQWHPEVDPRSRGRRGRCVRAARGRSRGPGRRRVRAYAVAARAPLDRHPRGRRHGARRRPRRAARPPPAAAPAARRADRRRGRAVRALRRWSRARARATSAPACCRCGPTSRPTRCPTTTRRRSSGGCASTIPSRRPRSGCGPRRRCGCSARSARPGASSAWEKVLVWSHWLWFAFPHGTVAYLLLRHPRPLPGGRGADLRDVRPRRDRLLGGPDRAALVRGARGPDGGRPHARAAADDGRVRRAVLEARLGAAVRFPGRQSAGRHAVAALRHVGHGRALLASTGRVAGVLGWAYAATLGAGARLPRRALRGRPRRRPRAGRGHPRGSARAPRRRSRGVSRAVQALEARAARMTDRPARPVGGRRRAGSSSLTFRNAVDARRLPARRARRALLPAAEDRRPGGHVAAHRGRRAALAALRARLHARDVRRLRRAVPRGLRARRRAPGSAGAASYQITMAGLAASRLFAAGGAGGLVLTAWALRRAGLRAPRGRRQDDRVPRPHLLRLHGRARRLRLRAALRHLPRRRRRSR